jgi:hypothetical protein
MKILVLKNIVILFYLSLLACGVKGRPQPPLTPALLGRGQPSFSKATEKVKVKKRNQKKIEGDFEEPDDFTPAEDGK